jgi:uncharacterized membrane protein YhhN
MMDYRRNVALDLVLTVLLCGLWNLIVQYEQCKTINALLKTPRFVYWKVGLLSLVTCGVYFIYYEYQKTLALQELTGKRDDSETVLAVVLSIVGFNWVWDAVYQTKLNEYLDKQLEFRPNPSSVPPTN